MRCKYNTSVNIQCGKRLEQEKQPEFMGNLFFSSFFEFFNLIYANAILFYVRNL